MVVARYFITSVLSKVNGKKEPGILQKGAQGNDFFAKWSSQKDNEEQSRRYRHWQYLQENTLRFTITTQPLVFEELVFS